MNDQMKKDIAVYTHYLGEEPQVGKHYHSPLRNNDDTPSFSIVYDQACECVRWRDFGMMSESGSQSVNLIMEIEACSYSEAIERMESMDLSEVNFTRLKVVKDKPSPIVVVNNFYHAKDVLYWRDYGIEPKVLWDEGILSVKGIWWQNDDGTLTLGWKDVDDPAFLYLFDPNNASWKLYRPHIKGRGKWLSNNTRGVIEGYDTLNWTGDTLIISSSTKDRLCLKSIGYDSINPTSESAKVTLTARKETLERRYRNIIICYDGDDPGYESSVILSKETGWGYIDWRGELLGHKDFADVTKHEGKEQLETIIKKFI